VAILAVLSSVAWMSGCSVGNGVSTDGNQSTGDLNGVNGSLGLATSPYVEINLSTGVVTPIAYVPDLKQPQYRTTSLLMARIQGQGNAFYMGVFEVTQGQWVTMGGNQPWTLIDPAVAGPSGTVIAPGQPAFGISYLDVQNVLTQFSQAHHVVLSAPSAQQWQFACAAGSTGAWSWGNATDQATLQANAVVWETHGANLGTHTVGGLNANAFGLYDMHGNVWEWLSPGTQIAGGSWSDSYSLAKTANVVGSQAMISPASEHVLIGTRWIYQP
jgi:hypothetical protein